MLCDTAPEWFYIAQSCYSKICVPWAGSAFNTMASWMLATVALGPAFGAWAYHSAKSEVSIRDTNRKKFLSRCEPWRTTARQWTHASAKEAAEFAIQSSINRQHLALTADQVRIIGRHIPAWSSWEYVFTGDAGKLAGECTDLVVGILDCANSPAFQDRPMTLVWSSSTTTEKLETVVRACPDHRVQRALDLFRMYGL